MICIGKTSGMSNETKECKMKKYTIGLITGALLAVSAMMFMGAQNKNLGDIIVNSITVKDGGNGGFISTYNTNGKQTAYLGTKSGRGRLEISNSDGKEKIYLGKVSHGYGLYTINEKRKSSGFFGADVGLGYGKILLYDRHGNLKLSASGRHGGW